MTLFWNASERRLRAGWRIALQVLLMIALGLLPILLIAEPLTALHRHGLFLPHFDKAAYDYAINMIAGPFLTAAIVASIVLARRFLDHAPLEGLGVVLDRAWWRSLSTGYALGAALMIGIVLVETAAGWIEWTGVFVSNTGAVSLGLGFAYSVVKVLCAATYEEFVFRGYILRNLIDGLGRLPAVALSCLAFGAIHMTNENASLMSTIGLVVNGGLFLAAAMLTGRLSTAIGVHVAWNLFEGAVFGLPVSGDREPSSIFGAVQHGSELVTGGAFAPEAGLIGIAASLFGIAVLMMFAVRRPWRVSQSC